MLKKLKEISIDVAFIVCWKPRGVVSLSKALWECTFDYLAEAKKVWYDDTELICPYCNGRCLCDAEVYYKLLDRETNHED
jgi:anaerobic selenocysteine-containing dehydrogenase